MTLARSLRRAATFAAEHHATIAFGLVALCALLTPELASAYAGQSVVTWARNFIVAPMSLLLIIVTIGAAVVKPDMAKQAGYTAIVAVILLALMSGGDTLLRALEASN